MVSAGAPEPVIRDVTSIDGEAPGTGLPRLPFVDGVRGLAAVVVLANHAIFFVATRTVPQRFSDAGFGDVLAWPFRLGPEMVELFLFISGFSLYYSELARRSRGRPPTTLGQFAARRAWRIGPVYYLAFAFGLVVTLSLSGRLVLIARYQGLSLLHTTTGGVISHLFFVHSFKASWLYQVNAPLWSIAYEVQLYLLFPLVYFAMRRWNPWLVALAVVIAVRLVNLPHPGFPLFGLTRWFVAGALLAELAHRGVRLRARIALPLGLAALLLGIAQLHALRAAARHDLVWLTAFVLLMFASLEYPSSRRNPLAWRWMRWIGLRSYSLYALHFPIILLLMYAAQRASLTGWGPVALTLGVGGPASVAAAAVSFRFVEGPSLERVARVGRTPGKI